MFLNIASSATLTNMLTSSEETLSGYLGWVFVLAAVALCYLIYKDLTSERR